MSSFSVLVFNVHRDKVTVDNIYNASMSVKDAKAVLNIITMTAQKWGDTAQFNDVLGSLMNTSDTYMWKQMLGMFNNASGDP